ncbi:hypothetical protein ACFJIV_05255 [Mucilaginibacter sp. UC70_90]
MVYLPSVPATYCFYRLPPGDPLRSLGRGSQSADTNFIARVEINLQEKKFSSPLGLLVHSFGAFVVYWDGVRVGQNGVPAAPGPA